MSAISMTFLGKTYRIIEQPHGLDNWVDMSSNAKYSKEDYVIFFRYINSSKNICDVNIITESYRRGGAKTHGKELYDVRSAIASKVCKKSRRIIVDGHKYYNNSNSLHINEISLNLNNLGYFSRKSTSSELLKCFGINKSKFNPLLNRVMITKSSDRDVGFIKISHKDMCSLDILKSLTNKYNFDMFDDIVLYSIRKNKITCKKFSIDNTTLDLQVPMIKDYVSIIEAEIHRIKRILKRMHVVADDIFICESVDNKILKTLLKKDV